MGKTKENTKKAERERKEEEEKIANLHKEIKKEGTQVKKRHRHTKSKVVDVTSK